jgi:UDP:flavonoid glycosyltransferase YjiC (YdhE family)
VVPFGFDQFDNAERVRRQGAAEVLYRHRYSAARAAKALGKLLGEARHAQAARLLGERVAAETGCAMAAEALEKLL